MNGKPPTVSWETGRLTRSVTLPPDAEIVVAVGEQVEPATPLANVSASTDSLTLSLAAELGVNPEQVVEHLAVQQGETIDVGSTLAERRRFVGIRRLAVVAPKAGRVAFISRDTGTMVIEQIDGSITVPALTYGTVASIDDSSSRIVLEMSGLAIAGVLSFGTSACGPLVLWEHPEPPVSAAGWTSWQDAVVLLRTEVTVELLKAAAEHGAAAVVAPGSKASLLSGNWNGFRSNAEHDPLVPTLLLYGTVAPALPNSMLDALRPVAGTIVGISGSDHYTTPELLLTGPGASDVAARIGNPTLGCDLEVMIVYGELAGRVAQVIKIVERHLFESEWRGPAALVKIGDCSTHWVPLVTLVPIPTIRSK